jgi:hypothetical protein
MNGIQTSESKLVIADHREKDIYHQSKFFQASMKYVVLVREMHFCCQEHATVS